VEVVHANRLDRLEVRVNPRCFYQKQRLVVLKNRLGRVEGQERKKKVIEGNNGIYLELASAAIGWCRRQFQVHDPHKVEGIRDLAI
jgi:hypothetical protein